MAIIGISCFFHDSAAALIKDGDIIVAVQEERFTRKKHDQNFPKNAIIWELNYRGDLLFLDQAKAAKELQCLQIEDGWTYFIHGWTQVIAEVFSIEIPVAGDRFEDISRIAAKATGRSM